MNVSNAKKFGIFRFRLLLRFLLLALLAAFSNADIVPALAQNVSPASPISPESDKLLHRLFASTDFEVKNFGPARWLNSGQSYTTVETSAANKDAQDIVSYETATGKRDVLVSSEKLIPSGEKSPLAIEDYAWSKDKTRLLIYTNSIQVWRLNTRGDYWVLNLASGAFQKLGGDAPASSLMFAKFSPDGSQVAYVRANNIYVEDLASHKIMPLTTDGSASLINGTSDWVYEEELDVRDGFRWSPNGRHIAYWQFDTTGVQIFRLIYNLGAPREIVTGFPYPGLGRYPSILDIAYPIPGTTNSSVRVGVVDIGGGDTRWMAVPGDPRDNYIARMDWAGNSNELAIEHLNRLQNTNDVLIADQASGAVRSIFQDKDAAWVDVVPEITWLHNGAEFLWISERDGWRHAYLISRDGSRVQLITHGNFDVIEPGRANEKGGWFYFSASPENVTQRYLYRTRLDGSGNAERVSPSNLPGTHSYDISPDCRWALHQYSRADVTPVTDLVELPAHHS